MLKNDNFSLYIYLKKKKSFKYKYTHNKNIAFLQNVSVLVMKDKKERSTSLMLPVLNDSLRSGFLGESDFFESTVVESTSRPLKIDNIFNFPKEIDLHTSKVGIVSGKMY